MRGPIAKATKAKLEQITAKTAASLPATAAPSMRLSEMRDTIQKHGAENAVEIFNANAKANGQPPLSPLEAETMAVQAERLSKPPALQNLTSTQGTRQTAAQKADAVALAKEGKLKDVVTEAPVVQPDVVETPAVATVTTAMPELTGNKLKTYNWLSGEIDKRIASQPDVKANAQAVRMLMSGEAKPVRAAVKARLREKHPEVHAALYPPKTPVVKPVEPAVKVTAPDTPEPVVATPTPVVEARSATLTKGKGNLDADGPPVPLMDLTHDGKTVKVYQDPDNGTWYADSPGHFTKNGVGETRDEVLSKAQEIVATHHPKQVGAAAESVKTAYPEATIHSTVGESTSPHPFKGMVEGKASEAKMIDVYHATDTEPGKGQKSGYYPGTYTYPDKAAVAEFGKAQKKPKTFTTQVDESKLYVLKEGGDALKKEAEAAGFRTHGGSGHEEVQYLKSKGFEGMKRGNEVILFDNNKSKFTPHVEGEVAPTVKPETASAPATVVPAKGDRQRSGEEGYFKGDKGAYTGKTEEHGGGLFYEMKMKEGPQKGQTVLVRDHAEKAAEVAAKQQGHVEQQAAFSRLNKIQEESAKSSGTVTSIARKPVPEPGTGGIASITTKTPGAQEADKLAKHIVEQVGRNGMAVGHPSFAAHYRDMSADDRKHLLTSLVEKGLLPEKYARTKSNFPTAYGLEQEVIGMAKKAEQAHKGVATNRHVPFTESEFYKKATGGGTTPAATATTTTKMGGDIKTDAPSGLDDAKVGLVEMLKSRDTDGGKSIVAGRVLSAYDGNPEMQQALVKHLDDVAPGVRKYIQENHADTPKELSSLFAKTASPTTKPGAINPKEAGLPFDLESARMGMDKRGYAEYGDHKVKVVPHPNGGTGDKATFAVEHYLSEGKGGANRTTLPTEYKSIEEAQNAALNELNTRVSGKPTVSAPTADATTTPVYKRVGLKETAADREARRATIADLESRVRPLEKKYSEVSTKETKTPHSHHKKKAALRQEADALGMQVGKLRDEQRKLTREQDLQLIEDSLENPKSHEHYLKSMSEYHDRKRQEYADDINSITKRRAAGSGSVSVSEQKIGEHQKASEAASTELLDRIKAKLPADKLNKDELQSAAEDVFRDFGDRSDMDRSIQSAMERRLSARKEYRNNDIDKLTFLDDAKRKELKDEMLKVKEAGGPDWHTKLDPIIEKGKVANEEASAINTAKVKADAEAKAKQAEIDAANALKESRAKNAEVLTGPRYIESVKKRASQLKGTVEKITPNGPVTETTERVLEREKISPTWDVVKRTQKIETGKKRGEMETVVDLVHTPTGLNALTTGNPKQAKEFLTLLEDQGIDLSQYKDAKQIPSEIGQKLGRIRRTWENDNITHLNDTERAAALGKVQRPDPGLKADMVLGADDLGVGGEKQHGVTSAKIGDKLKVLAEEVPEFGYNPVMTVTEEGRLLFRNGFKYEFKPEAFNLHPSELTPGQTVGINLDDMGIKRATENDVVLKSMQHAGYESVKQSKSGIITVVPKKGKPAITVQQVRPEQWQATGGAAKDVQEKLDKIRWVQPKIEPPSKE